MELVPGTKAYALYGRHMTEEPYRCHYSLNPSYREAVLSRGLVASGTDMDGEVRLVERTDHPFFLAALFVPQLAREQPHALFLGLLRAALSHRAGGP